MDETLVNFLNNIGLGTFISVALVVGAAGLAVYKYINKAIEKYKVHVIKKNEEKEEQEKFHQDMCDLAENVKDLSSSMVKLNDRVDKLETYEKNEDEYRNDMKSTLLTLNDSVELLIASDKDDIKSFITTEYYKWTKLNYIEFYAKEALEARYDKYVKEKGNTFVGDLMEVIRKLEVK